MRRNPSPAWFRRLQVRDASLTRRMVLDAADRVIALAESLHEEMTARERRRAAARLTLDIGMIEVVTSSGLWAPDDRSAEQLQAEVDEWVARLAPIIDAEVETILGEWRGARKHTIVSRGAVPQPVLDEAIAARDELYAASVDTEAWNEWLRVIERLRSAAVGLRNALVRFDVETYASFNRVDMGARSIALPSYGIIPRRPGRRLSPDELAARQREVNKNRRKGYIP